MTDRLLYETHMHTPLCKHAQGEPEEYAAVAESRGLAGIIVTCHNPMPPGFAPSLRMGPEELDAYLALVFRARDAWAGKLRVRLGIECDYFPGQESFLEHQTTAVPFEYVLGSVHPQLDYYAEAFWRGDPVEYQRTYFTHLADAAETGLFDCLSHPDLVKNCFPQDWRVDRLLDHIRRCLDRVADTGIAMELNTSGLNKTVPEFNPGATMLAEMRARDIPVVVGADAHVPERVGADFADALDALAEAGYTHVSLFLERQRRDVSIPEARVSLKGRVDQSRTST